MTLVDSRAFRHLMGCFVTGIAVATILDPKLGRVGITINSLTSVSLKPPLILFCLDKKAHVYKPFSRAEAFAINILADDQQDVSQYFANYHKNPEPKNLWAKKIQPSPILKDTLGWMVCRRIEMYKGGDHSIFLGETIALHRDPNKKSPLIYFQSEYRKLTK